MQALRLRATLREVEPVVIRVLDVPAAVLLPEVHDLLQAVLGWTDSHLHQFEADGVTYGINRWDPPEDQIDEETVRLRALPSAFTYLYDFSDGWEHDIEILGPGGERPGCVAGESPCPPEDCGGPSGYARFRATLSNPDHPEHEETRTWGGEWSAHFDLAQTDLFVRQMAGAVPASVRMLLELTAGASS